MLPFAKQFPAQRWFEQKSFAKVNCAVAAALLAAMLTLLGILTHRLVQLRQQQKHWTQRRARLVGIHMALLLIQVRAIVRIYAGCQLHTVNCIEFPHANQVQALERSAASPA